MSVTVLKECFLTKQLRLAYVTCFVHSFVFIQMSLEGLKISTTGHSSMVYWDMILLSMVEIISTKLHGVIEEGNINAYCCENLKFRRNRLISTSLGLEEGNPNCCVSFKTPFDRTLTSDNDFPPHCLMARQP